MKREILKYLKSYSYDTFKIDRLIVSAFLYSNDLVEINNDFIRDHLITEGETDFENLQRFLEIHSVIDFENLIELFEFVISPAEKVVSGAVYTPVFIREFIVENAFNQLDFQDDIKVCDPACGCAGFLYSAAKRIKEINGRTYEEIFENNIFGVDIQEYSVKRSKLLLSLLAISEGEDLVEFSFNIHTGNSLSFSWADNITQFEGFDLIVGNPPYVCSRNIEEESKVLLQNWKVCSTGHPDLYIPFFELGIESLKPNGVLGYITMNSFFKSVNGRALREYFGEKMLSFEIIDFAGLQIFNSKSTYTCICLIQNIQDEYLSYNKLDNISELETNEINYNRILYNLLDANNGWNLNEIEFLNRIESIGEPLGIKYKSRNGIATLKNKIYIFDITKEDADYYYLDNGSVFPIEKEICKDIINPNKLIKNNSIKKLKKKLIFPYFYDAKSNVKLIGENDFIEKYPCAYNYLLSQKEELAKRDKGKGKYEAWYAFGRNQSLEKLKHKLFFPHITPTIPNYVINSDENLFFHNGLAIIGKNKKELEFLKKLLSSRLFWFYITNSSRMYGHDYFSLSKNYFKNFGVYDFSEKEIDYILNEKNRLKIDKFIEQLYGVNLN
ncbi:MAG: SAM-dependent methyltransferase [Vallitalea sp.]|jgi:methylase of polypeptide subunit release factors|nr:SAM-dependent methyltransferase [Vallitalea sp.]